MLNQVATLPASPPPPHIAMGGSAGTGKTFTVQHLVRHLSDTRALGEGRAAGVTEAQHMLHKARQPLHLLSVTW